jgi:phage terminase large subunit
VSYNPIDEVDPTHQMFRIDPPPDAYVAHVGWQHNKYFPIELERLRLRMMEVDHGAYDWVWEGYCRRISEAAVFRDHYVIEAFDPPDKLDRVFYGIDWGFANDPLFAIRCWIHDEHLYVDQEFCGIGIDIDEMDACLNGGTSPKTGLQYDGIPGIKQWPIKADNARPELISYLSRQGYHVTEAEKWNGSVEDGIAHLLGFKKIHIHERCVNLAQEARLYSYKTDPKQLDPNTGNPVVLPKVDDKHNHGWDAIRYALDGYIQYRGGVGVWRHLVRPRR